MTQLNDRKVRAAHATVGLALLAASALTAVVPAHATARFDGTWSVLIVTERGTCDRAYRYPVRIAGGTVGYDGQAGFTVSGRVNPNGAISVKVTRGDQSASGAGRLAGSTGTGSWRASECSGVWSAERR